MCLIKIHRKTLWLKGFQISLKSNWKIPASGVCPVFKTPIIISGENHDNSLSLDRIDNTKGYTKDNCVVISYKANRLKSDSTFEELKLIKEFYTKFDIEKQTPYEDNGV